MNGGKSQMPSQHVDETLLISYLLGKLTEDEKVQVENRAFADPDYLGALEAAEADLIDAYVRNELPKPDCNAFECQFLTSPSRRSKVEFARTFARVATELHEPSVPASGSTWQRFAALFRAWSSKLQFTAALAALACLIAGSWLVVENARMRSRLTALEVQQHDAELRRQLLQRQLTEEQSRVASLTQPRRQPSAERGPLIASLLLTPGISRGQSNVQTFALGSSVQIAHIEIELESRDDFPQFRAGLHTRSGKEILTFASLHPRRTATGSVVSFDVPASTLATAEYELALQGLSPGQLSQDIGYYYFRVQKR
jgi:hypothetical protein